MTYENGDLFCIDCFNQSSPRLPRIKSAHFLGCSICNSAVKGKKYYTEENGDVICMKCEISGPRCAKCDCLFKSTDTIREIDERIKYHEYCLDCSVCSNRIETDDFYKGQKGEPLCSNCYNIAKLIRCFACGDHIPDSYVVLDNRPFHKECFKCSNCSVLIDPAGFYRNRQTREPVCAFCNQKLNAPKCSKCSKPIEKDAIPYEDKRFHPHCFKCDKCGADFLKMKKFFRAKIIKDISAKVVLFSIAPFDVQDALNQLLLLHLLLNMKTKIFMPSVLLASNVNDHWQLGNFSKVDIL